MQLWFYKAEYGDWWDKVISLWTMGPYSHVELVFSDGMCFSSSSRDGGVRCKVIPLSDHWTVVDIGFDHIEQEMRAWAQTEIGKAYDWPGCIGCGLGMPFLSHNDKWYCSEITTYALDRFRIRHCPDAISPNHMYRMVTNTSPPTNDHLPSEASHNGQHH